MTDEALWFEQYRRMVRWSRRLWLGTEHIFGGGDDALIDAFYAFTQACYHLVDWLEKDHSQPVRRGLADAHVHSCAVLAYCKDICDGSKHARLETKSVTKIEKSVSSYLIVDESGHRTEESVVQPQLFVYWEGEFIDVSQFAEQCIDEWNRFLRSQGLLPSDAGPSSSGSSAS